MEVVNVYKEKSFLTTGRDVNLYRRDNNYCTVVALCVVTGRSYTSCFRYMQEYGRKFKSGMIKRDWNRALETMNTFKVIKGVYTQQNRITINQFIKKHPIGTYYCANNGHAFAIINGVLYDHTEGKRRQITCAYRVYSQQELMKLKRKSPWDFKR